MSTLSAVLWDMDGTLVDTEILWDKAIYGAMEEIGSPLTPAQRARTVGMSMDNLLRTLAGFAGSTDETLVRTINDKILTAMSRLYTTEMHWQPGAQELVNELHAAGIPQALVTNTKRVLTRVTLQTIGSENFAVSVCGDEVPAGKPAADPYVKAATMLCLPPESCLVIEDSMTGISAGLAAGCHVLGIHTDNRLDSGEDYEIWDSLLGVNVQDLRRYMSI